MATPFEVQSTPETKCTKRGLRYSTILCHKNKAHKYRFSVTPSGYRVIHSAPHQTKLQHPGSQAHEPDRFSASRAPCAGASAARCPFAAAPLRGRPRCLVAGRGTSNRVTAAPPPLRFCPPPLLRCWPAARTPLSAFWSSKCARIRCTTGQLPASYHRLPLFERRPAALLADGLSAVLVIIVRQVLSR